MSQMSPFVLALRRKYPNVVTLEKLDALLAANKISQAEYDYIIAPVPPTE